MNGAPWWVTLLAAMAGGAIALGGALVNGRLDRRRARREEWFRRVQWAQQLTASDRERDREAGYRLLRSLGDSDLATTDDIRLLYDLTDDSALTDPPQSDPPVLYAVEDTENSITPTPSEEDGQ